MSGVEVGVQSLVGGSDLCLLNGAFVWAETDNSPAK